MKPFIVIQGPVATRSGYGNHTRDLATALIRADKYDIQLISLPWGVTPMNALQSDNTDHMEIVKRIATKPITRQPDVFIQVSVPNEFGIGPDGKPFRAGKYNIGVTAGIETTAVSAEFLQGANRMDLIITTSEHSKKGFVDTMFDAVDNKTKQKTGQLKLEKPIEVLFEGVDLNTYKKLDTIQDKVSTELRHIKDNFCYLFVGHWLKGDIGQDRKDVGMMIKTFCEAFKRKSAKNRPGLILKTSHAHFSIIDRDEIMKKIQSVIKPYGKDIPNIYLLHGDMTDSEMNTLYNHPKVKAMVSFTKGEGFGRPLAEFARTGKPIIASNWSGHVDFLHKDYCVLLPGELTKVHDSAADQFILKDTNWFTVNYAYAAKILQDVITNYKGYLEKSRKMPHHMKKYFSLERMADQFCKIVDKGLENVPQQVGLKLPKLSKMTKTEDKKIKLPKLKKVEI
jgi:glycosyltransferase involved in cell wall biosynthesis